MVAPRQRFAQFATYCIARGWLRVDQTQGGKRAAEYHVSGDGLLCFLV